MNDQYKWGDDPGTALVKASGSPLALQIESEVVASYLLQLRGILETDTQLADKVAGCKPAKDAKPDLIASFKLVKPGTEHLLNKAADILLEEFEQQRQSNSSLYLVSCKTGRSVMPIGVKDVYTPPDFEGLDGEMHKSKPVVHPGISSSLAIAAHEAAKNDALVAIAGQELAFAHLSTPEQMIELAKQKLAGSIIFAEIAGPWNEIEFGRENAAGMEQSVNSAFHRIELFSSILAKRILSLCGRGGRCQVGDIVSRQGAKQRWYSLDLKWERLNTLGIDEQLSKD